MAATTIMRSIAFSRATASAICSSSRRFALTAIGSLRSSSVGRSAFSVGIVVVVATKLPLLAGKRFSNQSVAEDELGVVNVVERDQDRRSSFRDALELDANAVAVDAGEA